MKKIRDESGAWIPATYKSKRYAQWKERTKIEENFAADSEDDGDGDGDGDHGDQKRNQLCGMFKMYFVDHICNFIIQRSSCCLFKQSLHSGNICVVVHSTLV